MAEAVREEARRKRAGARQQRRSPDGDRGADASDPMAAAKRAARTAAAAALAGALVGASKALAQRRRDSNDGDVHGDHAETKEEPADTQTAQPADEPAEHSAVDQSRAEDDDDDAADAPLSRARADDEDDDVVAPSPSRPMRREDPEHGAPSSEVSALVDRARGHVEKLLGKEAESVSGIAKYNGAWSVMVEVVEVQRIPDSTDILASYEVVLDGDGDLIRIERQGRYRRSQVEEDR